MQLRSRARYHRWYIIGIILIVCLVALTGVRLLSSQPTAAASVQSIEGEAFTVPTGGSIQSVSSASNGQVLLLTQKATATKPFSLTAAATSVVITAKGQSCFRSLPQFVITVDGATVTPATMTASSYQTYTLPITTGAGNHTIGIKLVNAYQNHYCTRNLFIDTVAINSLDSGRVYPWHTNIVSTTFWVGEIFNASLADGSQVCSTYDSQWAYHWSGINNGGTDPSSGCTGAPLGGCDGVPSGTGNNFKCATEVRTAANNYFPTKVPTPRENPFYLDLPYDDLNDSIGFSQRCQTIPWANDPGYSGHCTDGNFSYMKNRWVRIVGPNGNTCYGQIQDAGPSHGSLYHDSAYVFGANDVQPIQGNFNNAGMDVSPALNGCLGFASLDGQDDRVNWQFVDDADVPAGPWKQVVTTSGVFN